MGPGPRPARLSQGRSPAARVRQSLGGDAVFWGPQSRPSIPKESSSGREMGKVGQATLEGGLDLELEPQQSFLGEGLLTRSRGHSCR